MMNLVPGRGFSKLVFGLREQDVETLIGPPVQILRGDYFVEWWYQDLMLMLRFEDRNESRLGWIKCMDQSVSLLGCHPWDVKLPQLKSVLIEELGEGPEWREDPVETLFFPVSWLGLQAECGHLSAINAGVPYDEHDEPIWPGSGVPPLVDPDALARQELDRWPVDEWTLGELSSATGLAAVPFGADRESVIAALGEPDSMSQYESDISLRFWKHGIEVNLWTYESDEPVVESLRVSNRACRLDRLDIWHMPVEELLEYLSNKYSKPPNTFVSWGLESSIRVGNVILEVSCGRLTEVIVRD